MVELATPIKSLTRVGTTTANRLAKLGLRNVRDLLFYFPFRYEDFRSRAKIAELRPGQNANIVGEIEMINNRRSPRKKMSLTEAIVSDESDRLKIIWFNQPFIGRNLKAGDKVSLAGKIEGEPGNLLLKSPVYEKLAQEKGIHTQGIIPIYHLTSNITQKQLRFLMKQALGAVGSLRDGLPGPSRKRLGLIDIQKAIKQIHFPRDFPEMESARQRLAFEELFIVQLESVLAKQRLDAEKSPALEFKEEVIKKFVASLPFTLTDAQKKNAWQIIQDTGKSRPMSRLLAGDVGSGKTIVAAMAMLNAAANKQQSVLLVPTEILAQQHYNNLNKHFQGLDVKIALFSRSQKLSNWEEENEKELVRGADMVIGTHALIQEKIEFKRLGLAIIDEQHRFGVDQRRALREKSGDTKTMPHLLSMTATPIPRTLALALYGDLSHSRIDEMPKNRKSIITRVVDEAKRPAAYGFIRKLIDQGRQVFVVCPLIDISDKLGVKSAKAEYEKLSQKIFPDLPIGLLHGRQKSREKDRAMRDFLDKKTKILVSTSVIEVGVDVENAAIMMIEDADRFGLAQLHQIRGRVGRSKHQSYCLLFTESRRPDTLERLNALSRYNDGFKLAQVDLKFRGPGEVFGVAQKGFPEMKMASLFDHELMKQARAEAESIIENDPKLDSLPHIRDKIRIVDQRS